MSFKVNARTLLHLGAELISSDAVALYELVKNAFDAGSNRVAISVTMRLPKEALDELLDEIDAAIRNPGDPQLGKAKTDERSLELLRSKAISLLSVTTVDQFADAVRFQSSLASLRAHMFQANSILVSDTGEGMSLADLNGAFLTIGTTKRRRELDERRLSGFPHQSKPILGEKGVGRLSSMRLGTQLRVESCQLSDSKVNLLNIDWTAFSHDSDELLEDIPVQAEPGPPKENPSQSGTKITIYGLSSDWSQGKLEEIAKDQFSRLNDPFSQVSRYPIDLTFNGALVAIPPFTRMLLNEAHAIVKLRFALDESKPSLEDVKEVSSDVPHLTGSIDYRLRMRSQVIDLTGIHLSTAVKSSMDVLRRLGPFDMELYWFNRPLLEGIDSIGSKRAIQRLVNEWSGGVMVYRDGFRVGAYGSGPDDWLDLDKKALSSGGFKVNRSQIIGRLSISSIANPFLVDQTNREGIKDSPEKLALVNILRHVVDGIFRPFLNTVEKDVLAKEPVDFADVIQRVSSERKRINLTVKLLYQRYPLVKADQEVSGQIEEAMKTIGETLVYLHRLEESYEKGRSELVLLAGIGLTVSAVAHELNRATADALVFLDKLRRQQTVTQPSSALAPLAAQLKTLVTRLKVLDPLVTSGRQVRESVDLAQWLPEVVESSARSIRDDGIKVEVLVDREPGDERFQVRVVRGMIVQIVENLLSNAHYWLRRSRLSSPNFEPHIVIHVDTRNKAVLFSDNGPGVEPSMRDTIFQAFVTTKPPGHGSGLGLFISREVAHYCSAELALEPVAAPNMSTTFALTFSQESR